jgi:uncharacterized membrane protein YfbV (UPF0208 family)
VLPATKQAKKANGAILRVFTLCWQIALGGQLGPAVATALFALSLPMQGLWWLGKRSVTPLPPSILNWFYEVRVYMRFPYGITNHQGKFYPVV